MSQPRRFDRHLLLFGALALGACGGAATDFAGEFRGGGVELRLQGDGLHYTGELQKDGQRFSLQAAAEGEHLQGSFHVGDDTFAFTLAVRGDGFELVSDGTRYQLTRQQAVNPLSGKATVGAPSPAMAEGPTTKAAAAPKVPEAADRPSTNLPKEIEQATPAGRVAVSGPIYTHPLGVRFRYPEGWRLQEVEEGVLSLVPADVHSNEFGALELFLVVGDSADGLTSAQDPQVGGLLDQILATFPFLRRQGEVKPIELAGRAQAEYAWSGKNDRGDEFEGRAWASIVDGFALAVIGITTKDRLAQRQPMLQAIASSFHFKAPPVDRRLVGNWSNENHYSAGTGYSGTLARYLQFRPDGSCYWSSRAFALLSTSDTSGNYSGTQMRDTGAPKDASSGRWTATGSELRILWDSGQSDHYTFEQSGDSLLLIDKADGRKRLWSR